MTTPNDVLAAAIAEALAKALLPQLSALVSAQTNIRAELAELNEGIALGSHYIRRVAVAAEALAAGEQDPNDAPDIEMPLETFAGFDWSSISAEVVARDEFGPSILSFGGKAFKRRSPDNAYDPAVWFSRCVGKDEAGKNQYVRLITFRPMSDKVEPMGRKVERAVAQATAAHPQPAPQSSNAPAKDVPAARPAVPPQPDPAAVAATHVESDAAFEALPPAPRVSPPPKPAPHIGPKVSGGALADEEPELPTWCEWCQEAPALPGVPCDACRRLGATAENRPGPFSGATQPAQPALQPATPPAATATRSDQATDNCRLCGLDHGHDESAVKRQATLSLPGAAGARWRDWARDFAHRFPHYRLGRGEDVDMYHILLTVAHLRRPTITIDNLDEVIARLERYAAGHHPA